jgi:hypothetical protein
MSETAKTLSERARAAIAYPHRPPGYWRERLKAT